MGGSSSCADIEELKRVVVEAGTMALERCGKVGVEYKADASVVTDADREVELFIRGELNRLYPDYAFVGEEFGWQGAMDRPIWACDPIDGTTNYVCGLPIWGTSVGLLVDGVSEMGAVYLPREGELYWAVRGGGAFCNGQRIQATDRESIHPEDTVCLTSNSIKTLNPEVIDGRIRALGSIAAELVYTARGILCGTVGLYEGIVDMAASFCILAESGCEIRYLDGSPMDVAALTRAGRTSKHFIVAPPKMLALLTGLLRTR